MADVLPTPAGLNLRPGIDYPEDPYYQRQQVQEEYSRQLQLQQVSSRLEAMTAQAEENTEETQTVDDTAQALRSLRDLRRIVTGLTLVGAFFLFFEMHIRLIVCNLLPFKIPLVGEDKLTDTEVGVLLFVDWMLMTVISIFFIVFLPLLDPKITLNALLSAVKSWWDGFVSQATTSN